MNSAFNVVSAKAWWAKDALNSAAPMRALVMEFDISTSEFSKHDKRLRRKSADDTRERNAETAVNPAGSAGTGSLELF